MSKAHLGGSGESQSPRSQACPAPPAEDLCYYLFNAQVFPVRFHVKKKKVEGTIKNTKVFTVLLRNMLT